MRKLVELAEVCGDIQVALAGHHFLKDHADRRLATAREISRIEEQLARLPAQEIRYAGILRQYRAAESIYLTLLAERARARVAEGRDSDGFIVVDRAKPEKRAVSPRVLLTLLASLMIGIMLGIGIASAGGVAPEAGKQPARSTHPGLGIPRSVGDEGILTETREL